MKTDATNKGSISFLEVGETFLAGIIGLATQMIVVILVGRRLGPSSLGSYLLLTTVSMLGSRILSFGAELSSAVYVAQRNRLREIWTFSVLMAGLGAIVGLVTIFGMPNVLFSKVFASLSRTALLIAFIEVPFSVYVVYLSSMMVGLHEIRLLNSLNIISSISWVCVVVLGVFLLDFGVIGLIALSALRSASIAGVATICLAARYDLLGIRFEKVFFREIWGFGLIAYVGNTAHHILFRVPYFLVNTLMGAQALGFYGAATMITEKIWLLLQPIYTVAFSNISSGSAQDALDLSMSLARRLLFLQSLVGLLICALAWPLVQICFGDSFRPTVDALRFLLPGVILLGCSWFLAAFIIAHLKRPWITTIIGWLVLFAVTPLYFAGVRLFGINGAAVVCSIAYGLIYILTLGALRLVTGIQMRMAFLPSKEDVCALLRCRAMISRHRK